MPYMIKHCIIAALGSDEHGLSGEEVADTSSGFLSILTCCSSDMVILSILNCSTTNKWRF
jgi:hypothetical protein